MTSKNTPFGVIKKSSVFLLLKKTTIWVTILCKKGGADDYSKTDKIPM